jgi:hypothetical protein
MSDSYSVRCVSILRNDYWSFGKYEASTDLNSLSWAAPREAYEVTWRRIIILVHSERKSTPHSSPSLVARRKELVSNGKGNKPQAIDVEVDKLFHSGQFEDRHGSPEILQRAIWWLVPCISVLELGTEVVNLHTENDGQEMLVWLGERGTVQL